MDDPYEVDQDDRTLTLSTGAVVLGCIAALVALRLVFTGAVGS